MFISLLCIVVIRTILERLLESGHVFSYGTDFYDTIAEHAHYIIFWICLFTAIGFLLKIFMKLSIGQSFNVAVICSPLILTVPFIDFIITGGKGDIINYSFTFNNFKHIYVNLLNPFVTFQDISIGARLEIFIATVSALILPRIIFKINVVRCILLSLSIYHLVILSGFLPAIYLSCGVNVYSLKGFSVTGLNNSQAFFFMFIIPSIMLAATLFFLLYKENKRFSFVVADFLYPSRLFFFLLLLAFGFLHTSVDSGLYPKILNRADMLKFICAAISISLLFAYAKVINDLFDLDIDRISNHYRPLASNIITEQEAAAVGNLLLIISFIFASCVDRAFIFVWLFLWAASYLYSVPPFRLKRLYPVCHLTLSSIGGAVFLSGAAVIKSYQLYNSLSCKWILLCIFSLSFFFSHLKDFKDMEGDTAGGVFNLPYRTGMPKLIAVISVTGIAVFLLLLVNIVNVAEPFTFLILALYYTASCVYIFRLKDIKKLENFMFPLTFISFILIACWWLYTLG
jgi:4-hydroxybenzoate polyprenyltransferase